MGTGSTKRLDLDSVSRSQPANVLSSAYEIIVCQFFLLRSIDEMFGQFLKDPQVLPTTFRLKVSILYRFEIRKKREWEKVTVSWE